MRLIKDFQTKYGLVPDGQIGKKTLLKIKEVLLIPTIEALSHYMGQCDHESMTFTQLVENLNYSSQGLLGTFGKYFDDKTAPLYQRNPEKIANRVYANRMGNGNEMSGDGWRHRGFGPIQLTGKTNQDAFAKKISDPLIVDNPSLIAAKYAFESAKFFFDDRSLWSYCKKVDVASITKVSKLINQGNLKAKGDPNGLQERIEKTNHYYKILTT